MRWCVAANDVTNVAEYLAEDLAAFVSGQHLLVTGGAAAYISERIIIKLSHLQVTMLLSLVLSLSREK